MSRPKGGSPGGTDEKTSAAAEIQGRQSLYTYLTNQFGLFAETAGQTFWHMAEAWKASSPDAPAADESPSNTPG